MMESSNNEVATLDAQETKKQRKKQAKREAKMMLKLEQARAGVAKAEQKVAKTQARLEAARTHLRDTEAKVAELHAPPDERAEIHGEQPETSSPLSEATPLTTSEDQDTSTHGQQTVSAEAASHTDIPAPTDQAIAQPPAEERGDVTTDSTQGGENSSYQSESFVLSEEDETSTN